MSSEQEVTLHQLHHPSIYSINICLSLEETDLILGGIHILLGSMSKINIFSISNCAQVKFMFDTNVFLFLDKQNFGMPFFDPPGFGLCEVL